MCYVETTIHIHFCDSYPVALCLQILDKTRFSFLVFRTLYDRLLGYNMMLTCQFASQGFNNFSWHLHIMAWKYITSGSADFQGAFRSKMFQMIRTFLKNCLIIFIVSHKGLETVPVAAPAMSELTTKIRNLICSV